jgi:predicted negative regulator of RcsB-dependent stress response
MNWSTVGVSLLCSIVVVILTTFFNHRVWRIQKRHEQKLAIAEKFAKISDNMFIYTNLALSMASPAFTAKDRNDIAAASIEQNALLALAWTVFEKKETLAWLKQLNQELLKPGKDNFQKLHETRINTTVCLFAEALSIPIKDIDRKFPTFSA